MVVPRGKAMISPYDVPDNDDSDSDDDSDDNDDDDHCVDDSDMITCMYLPTTIAPSPSILSS